METNSCEQYFLIAQKYPEAYAFLNTFNRRDLFSPNWKLVQSCLEKMKNLPSAMITKIDELGMSFVSRYLILVMPPFFTDETLTSYFHVMHQIPNEDLDLIVSMMSLRFSPSQKMLAIFQLPDCASTFFCLGTFFNDPDLFLNAHQRIFSSYHIVQKTAKEKIIYCLRKSLLNGPARHHIYDIIETSILHHTDESIDANISAILDTLPNSLEATPPELIKKSIAYILKQQHVTSMTMQFLLTVKCKQMFTFQQAIYAIEHYPIIFFNYIGTLSEENSIEMWYIILLKISTINVNPVILPTLISIYSHYLATCLVSRPHLTVMESYAQIIDWFHTFISGMSDSTADLALFGIYLTLLRCFEGLSRVAGATFPESFEASFSQSHNKVALFRTVLWVLNPSTPCPFEDLCEFITKLDLPPPSSYFVFHIVPSLLPTILQIAITDSTPRNQPKCLTPHRMIKTTESTHSLVFLKIDDNDDDSSEDEADSSDLPPLIASPEASIEVQPLLRTIIRTLIPLYKNDELVSVLFSMSNTATLLPLVPFALHDDECFTFLCCALGVSCPFNVFATFYDQVSDNIAKTIKFFSLLSQYSQLVTDYLYVTSPIPLIVSSPYCLSVVMWVRPLGLSTLMTINCRSLDIVFKITKNSISCPNTGFSLVLPPTIGGWVMISVSVQNNVLTLSANLTSARMVFNVDLTPWNTITLGDQSAHFDLQSIMVFKTIVEANDLLYLFGLGPNHQHFVINNFMKQFGPNSMFVDPEGFISELYLPFRSKYQMNQKVETPIMNFLEMALAPPFRQLRHNSTYVANNKKSISVDRRRSCSFLNSLQCIGGMNLLVHLIGEVILKHPDLNDHLWPMISKLINTQPSVQQFFKDNHLYALIGHLMWSGSVRADHTISLAMQKVDSIYYITNPYVVKHWLLESQLFYNEMDDIVTFLINNMNDPHNANILHDANAFLKIINLLCGPCSHSVQFLSLLGNFALKLTNQINAEEHAKLVFDRLMICHFSFSQQKQQVVERSHPAQFVKSQSIASLASQIAPPTTVSLIRILQLILGHFPNAHVDLKLFLPAIVTAEPSVQVAIVVILIQRMSPQYLTLLGSILENMPFIDGMEDSIFAMLTSDDKREFVKITTCVEYFGTHVECKRSLAHLASFVDVTTPSTPESMVIALNQLLDTIAFIETHQGEQLPSQIVAMAIYKALTLGKVEETVRFILGITTIRDVPIQRLFCLSLSLLEKTIRIHQEHFLTNAVLDRAVPLVLQIGSMAIQKLRMTPGALTDESLHLIHQFTDAVIQLTIDHKSADSTQRLVYYLCDLFHIEFPSDLTNAIKVKLTEVPKISKQKRYAELLERIEAPGLVTPCKYVVPLEDEIATLLSKWEAKNDTKYLALINLSCLSIFRQAEAAKEFNLSDPESDYVMDMWHSIFLNLQFPGSKIYANCPVKWTVSDHATNVQQRMVLRPINPSIDKNYSNFWDVKFHSELPTVRLTLQEVLRFTPISLHIADDVKFSSHAVRISGISNLDGVIVVAGTRFRFYQNRNQLCEEVVTISLLDVQSLRLKSFQHQPKAVEVMCDDYSTYLFAFDTTNIRDAFVDLFAREFNITVQKSVNQKELNEMTKKWVDGNLTNFDYLLYLNDVSGRSWNDFTQYPIMPWVVSDYTSEKLDLTNSMRDLRYPIFAQTEEQRQQCLNYYRTTEGLGEEPHFTPNYISNVGSTLYFLVRAEPFTTEEIVFQGGTFDAADRTFHSFNISYSLMTSVGNKNALELIPEFYFSPAILMNSNDIVFPVSPISKRILNHVVLPPWASSPREFVLKMREALESPHVSRFLDEWIDLVWGYRRRGQKALERMNLFQSTVYEFDPQGVMDDRILMKALVDQIHNCGQAAAQLFQTKHPQRNLPVPKFYTGVVRKAVRRPSSHEKISGKSAIRDGSLSLTTPYGSTKLCFSDEIAISAFDTLDTFVATGHILPLLNIWKMSEKALGYVTTLRTHLSPVTSIRLFPSQWQMIVAGHQDGYLSFYSLNPMQFLREVTSGVESKVTMINVVPATGDIVAVQEGNRLSLFSINGDLIKSEVFGSKIVDIGFTTFSDGRSKNLIVILMNDESIAVVDALTLETVCKEAVKREGPQQIMMLKDNDGFNIYHKDGQITCWKFI